MNCKEIAGITDLICDKIKSKYPTVLNTVDKYSWVSVLTVSTDDYDYLAQIEIHRQTETGEYLIGSRVGESLDIFKYYKQSDDIELIANHVLDWLDSKIKRKIEKYLSIVKSLKCLVVYD